MKSNAKHLPARKLDAPGRSSPVRWILCLAAVCLLPAGGAVGKTSDVSLVRSDEGQVSFRIDATDYRVVRSEALQGTEKIVIPGFFSFSNPGEPSLPSRRLLVALPPNAGYSIRWTVLKSEPLGMRRIEPAPIPVVERDDWGEPFISERFTIDEVKYSNYISKPLVEAEAVARLRHQRVLPVWIHPVSYDAESGETAIATQIVVDISFTSAGTGRSRLDPMRDSQVVRESQAWERIYSKILVNPDQAPAWRVKSKVAGYGDMPSMMSGMSKIQGPLVKLSVLETGMYRVSAATVTAAGFPLNEPISNLKLFQRDYDEDLLQERISDISFTVHEDPAGTSGIFDSSDYVIFFGLSLRDDEDQGDRIRKFADRNCYWLGTGSGTTMGEQPLQQGYVSADTAFAAFDVEKRYEEDNWFIEFTPPDYDGIYPGPLRVDFYGFGDHRLPSLTVPFRVHAIKPGTSMQIEAEILGGPSGTADREIDFAVSNSLGSVPLNSALVPNTDRVIYTSQPIPDTDLVEGENSLLITESQDRGFLNAYILWASTSYEALYRAEEDKLTFHTASLAGDTSISVTGLNRKDLYLFDVTNPTAPIVRQVTDNLFTDTGNGYVLSFREALPSRKDFVLTPLEGMYEISTADVSLGKTNTLIGNPLENGVDVLMVSHPSYLDEMQAWVDYRRAQGYRLLAADVNDIYDEFNNGVPNPRGIKRFIEHFFERGNASFVVLVGDASEDSKNIHPESPPNFVPSESFAEHVGGVFGDEVVTSDKWYVLMDNDFIPGGGDHLPDLIIGRLPAGSGLEAQIMLNKIFAYENPTASDFWRLRMILVADDAWSAEGFSICYQPGENGFEDGMEETEQIIGISPCGGYDLVPFYLSDYTYQVHPPIGPCISPTHTIEAVRAGATLDLLDELSAGATLVSIQSHMNRHQIAHEWLMTTAKTAVGAGGGRDHAKIDNSGKPFIVFGLGCHFSDYALYKEKSPLNQSNNDASGDCFAELLLLQINKGAVSTYGSSGFEYLTPNRKFNNIIFNTFFSSPPQDTMVASNRAQVRWIFGEVMTLSELRYGSSGPIKRYHILGDPLLRIDAGPPRFDVTMNGLPVQTGDMVFSAVGSDTVYVEADICDEVAIDSLMLEIDGENVTGSMEVTRLLDDTLAVSRSYHVSFKHKLEARTYDIVLRALQAPDTSGNRYSMTAEFILRVQMNAALKVDGREIASGDPVPAEADYLLELSFPVLIESERIDIELDEVPVQGILFEHPTPQDTTTWLVSFHQDLSDGRHDLRVKVDGGVMVEYVLYVNSALGLQQVINYPNPFSKDTYFVYTNDVEISEGTIDIFTTSGKKIASLDIPHNARLPGQNMVYWDGRDFARDEIANGVYLYIVTVEQRGQRSTITGKLSRIE